MFDGADVDAARAVVPLLIECNGRNWAVMRFARPLKIAMGCGIHHSGSVSYRIGVSHARLWFVADGQAVEPVRRGFTSGGSEMNIMPWVTPADALRRQTRAPVALSRGQTCRHIDGAAAPPTILANKGCARAQAGARATDMLWGN
jgi:hypothetical protein